MARYRLSNAADKKIASIYEYSVLTLGEAQADSYFLGLHDLLDLLATNSSMGREQPDFGADTRRFLYEAHLVLYRPVADGIFVLDILGVRQKPLSGPPKD